jgi:ATP-dependent helicase/nuclease subunit A
VQNISSDTSERPFHIYRSSAGSGKTYTLTKEYLKIALQGKNAFRQILGVTFTNKATQEMKLRIVTVLREMSTGKKPDVQKELTAALNLTDVQIQKIAKSTLEDILHQYGRFSVVTIDSFFHQVIRAFAKEMGLQGSFSLDMDLSKVMTTVVDDMLLELGNDDKKSLKKWLTAYAEERVENGESWDMRKEIHSLSAEVLKDGFKPYSKEVLALAKDPKFFVEIKKELDAIIRNYEKSVVEISEKAIKLMKDQGVDPADFKGGKTQSPALLFEKVTSTFTATEAQRKKIGDRDAWIKPKDPKSAILETVIGFGLADYFDEVINFLDDNLMAYESAKEVRKYIYTYGILSEINRKIQDYRDENDVMLIADLPDFLHQIINDNETPYIYEKVGSMFENYLIDEFQDTSAFQWDNFRPLVKNASDQGQFSMVVGDVKQSIYRWRGGDWQLLQHQVKADIGDYHVHEDNLTMNWRSAFKVVKFNNDFFELGLEKSRQYFGQALDSVKEASYQSKIAERVEEVLSTYSDVSQKVPSFRNEGEGFVSISFFTKESAPKKYGDEGGEDEESDELAGWADAAIMESIHAVETAQENGYSLRDIAILTRNNIHGKRIANAFMKYKTSGQAKEHLAYDVVSSDALYLTSSHIVRFAISLIKWLNDEANTIVLAEWLFEYERYILKSDKSETAIFSSKDHWEKVVPSEFISQKDYLKTLQLYELVENLVKIFHLNELADEFIYLQGFQDAILDYSKNERGDISAFLEWWEEVKDKKTIQVSDENNAIKIMTIHKSKGLEFPVVIIPFLDWALDHASTNQNILWCNGGEEVPYNQLPILPLKYGKGLANTYWAMDYYEEKLKAFLDSINMLYVAFTRPVDALIVCGMAPSKLNLESITLKNCSDFALAIVKDLDGFDSENLKYQKGEWKIIKPSELQTKDPGQKPLKSEFQLTEYHSHTWRDKTQLQMRGAQEMGDEVFSEAQRQGIRTHELISKVKYKSDLSNVLDSPERLALTQMIEHPQMSDWFDPSWKVDTEIGILLPNGDAKRIDRINRSVDETLVIDFKTGSPRTHDQRQVKNYVGLMKEMGYPNVSGYLVYLTNMEVVEV